MLVIAETPTFAAEADKLWSEDERLAFFSWLAANPEAGNVIPRSGGCRKVRWSRQGSGKRGGVRVICFARLASGELWMLLVYSKSMRDNIPPHLLKAIRKELEDGQSYSCQASECWRGSWIEVASVGARNEGISRSSRNGH